MAKPEGQYDLIKNGVRDLVWAVPGYTRRPLRYAAGRQSCRFCAPSPAVCSPILWKWYEKHRLAAKEFTDTKLLATFMGGPFLHAHGQARQNAR